MKDLIGNMKNLLGMKSFPLSVSFSFPVTQNHKWEIVWGVNGSIVMVNAERVGP
jgi:hypothetical protein